MYCDRFNKHFEEFSEAAQEKYLKIKMNSFKTAFMYTYTVNWFFVQGVPEKTLFCVQRLLEALKNELQIKVG